MQLCRVVGNTVATVKAPGLADYKLLNVTPEKGAGPEFVAVDAVGAGLGDLVLVATGAAVRELDGLRADAADAAVVAIVDERSGS
jgi:ethanolamine utilization protein EutN